MINTCLVIVSSIRIMNSSNPIFFSITLVSDFTISILLSCIDFHELIHSLSYENNQGNQASNHNYFTTEYQIWNDFRTMVNVSQHNNEDVIIMNVNVYKKW